MGTMYDRNRAMDYLYGKMDFALMGEKSIRQIRELKKAGKKPVLYSTFYVEGLFESRNQEVRNLLIENMEGFENTKKIHDARIQKEDDILAEFFETVYPEAIEQNREGLIVGASLEGSDFAGRSLEQMDEEALKTWLWRKFRNTDYVVIEPVSADYEEKGMNEKDQARKERFLEQKWKRISLNERIIEALKGLGTVCAVSQFGGVGQFYPKDVDLAAVFRVKETTFGELIENSIRIMESVDAAVADYVIENVPEPPRRSTRNYDFTKITAPDPDGFAP